MPRLPRRSGAASRASRAPKPRPSAPPSTISATPATQNAVAVSSCHVCHVISRWMSPSATPATQNDRGCAIVPRLPREIKGDVTKCHACHAEVARRHGRHAAPKPRPSAPPSTISATPATQNDGGCEFVPRLPRDIKVDVTKCHACHAKRPWMCDCATPAT